MKVFSVEIKPEVETVLRSSYDCTYQMEKKQYAVISFGLVWHLGKSSWGYSAKGSNRPQGILVTEDEFFSFNMLKSDKLRAIYIDSLFEDYRNGLTTS